MERRELFKACVGASAAFAAAKADETKTELPAEMYAIVELMGHKRLTAKVSQAPIPGMLQLDVPCEGGYATQFINPASIYRLTVTDKDTVKRLASTDPLPPVCIERSPYQQLSIPEYADEDQWN